MGSSVMVSDTIMATKRKRIKVDEDIVSDGSDNTEVTTEEPEVVSGWADSMSKILGSSKPKNKKNLILSRAKKDFEISKTLKSAKRQIEVVDLDDNEIIEEDDDGEQKVPTTTLSAKAQRQLELKQKRQAKEWDNLGRVKPSDGDPTLERDLVKIATKGVVQLFNAVSFQQKSLKSKMNRAKRSQFQQDKVMSQSKDMFDVAIEKSKRMGVSGKMTNAATLEVKDEIKEEDDCAPASRKKGNANKKKWDGLQEDFMLDAKLKDWDQDSDSDSSG